MLNKTKVALLGAMAVVAMASTGAQAATQSADARAQIVAAVQIAQNDILDFGVIASGAAAGTVTLPNSSNVRTCSAGLTCAGTAALRGRFTVTAASGNVVVLTVPATASVASGGNTMSIALSPSVTSFTAGAAPTVFFVGGALSVAANQAAGTYTGTYNVSADYQ
jgi:hypothetical protein